MQIRFKEEFPQFAMLWKKYSAAYHRMEVPAKTVLLEEGDISKRAFYIERGCVRAWFNNKGKDVTFQFFFENEGVSSIESFRKKTPSLYSLETIEPSVLYWIHKKDLDAIMKEMEAIPELRGQMLSITFERQLNYMNHFMSFIRDTPRERYYNLVKERPDLIRRVPQHYIASYLGITSVSLSRIRNSIKK